MKAPFNDTCTVRTGPNSAPPNALLFITGCRLVLATKTVVNGTVYAGCNHYVTYQGAIVNAGNKVVGPTGFTVNTKTADRFAFASHPGIAFVVWFCETVTPFAGGTYRKAYLVQAGSGGFPL